MIMAIFVSIGYSNYVFVSNIIAILSPFSSPSKRIRDKAEYENRLLDATHGNKTRSMIIMNSNHVILSAINSETIAGRFNSNNVD